MCADVHMGGGCMCAGPMKTSPEDGKKVQLVALVLKSRETDPHMPNDPS